jgi:hypothetical protein
MNIFAVSECPRQAARDLDDARVIKQVTETAQLLSTVARLLAPEWVGQMGPLFRLAHEHHPVTEWVGSSWEAFSYALEHGLALHVEYCSRFPDRLGIHRGAIPINSVLGASRAFIQPRMFRHNAQPAPTLLNNARNLALGLDFTGVQNPVAAYRMYLAARWRMALDAVGTRSPKWTGTAPPEWLGQADLMAQEFLRGQSRATEGARP